MLLMYKPLLLNFLMMMKKAILIFLIISSLTMLNNNCFAQACEYHPFASDTAEWQMYSTGEEERQSWRSLGTGLVGDTLIYGKAFKKVYDPSNPSQFLWFIREENKRVWMKQVCLFPFDTVNILLYDFNLLVGDTFKTRWSLGNISMAVTKIDSVLTNTGYRKRWELKIPGGYSMNCSDKDYWIEGVGSYAGLLWVKSFGYCIGEAYEYLNSFKQNDAVVLSPVVNPGSAGIETGESEKEQQREKVRE